MSKSAQISLLLPLVALICVYLYIPKKTPVATNNPLPAPTAGPVHEHADLAIYIHNQRIDLSPDQFQSHENQEKHPYIHLHDNNGQVVHKHYTPVSMGEFFESINIHLSYGCIQIPDQLKYCTDSQNSLKFFVNSQPITNLHEYEMKDLDRILITYGPFDDLNTNTQLNSISQDACIYSEKCPERGQPPTENCTGSTPCFVNTTDSHDHPDQNTPTP